MADITSISNPRIKSYVGDCMLCETRFDDTAEETLQKFRKLTDKGLLWTGESTHCLCNHPVEQHCTARDRFNRVTNIHCHGSNKLCNCKFFIPCSIRLSDSTKW